MRTHCLWQELGNLIDVWATIPRELIHFIHHLRGTLTLFDHIRVIVPFSVLTCKLCTPNEVAPIESSGSLDALSVLEVDGY